VDKEALSALLKARENGKSVPRQILNLRLDFENEKRDKKLQILKEIRQNIIDDQ
jgi:hypothetical protein